MKKCSHYIFHTIFSFGRNFFSCIYPSPFIADFFTIWLPCFLRIYNLFTEKPLHPLLGIFLRFDHRFFWQLTNCLLYNAPAEKWQLKKGMTIPLKNQCMSCPISMVSVLTLAGGYKLFSGLLYWSEISVSGGWMLCTIHNAIKLSFEFPRQYYIKYKPRIMLKYVGWRKYFTASNPVTILYTNCFAFSIGFYEIAKRWAYLRPPFEPQKCFPSPGRSSPSPT